MPPVGQHIRELRRARGIGLKPLAKRLGVTHSHLSRLERGEVQASLDLLSRIANELGVSGEELELQAGRVPEDIAKIFADHPKEAALVVRETFIPYDARPARQGDRVATEAGERLPKPVYATALGALYRSDCLDLLRRLPSESVDLVFADPPFNLGKDYGRGIPDKRKDDDYLAWSREWLLESVRVLSPGGALFAFNLPKWLIHYGATLSLHGMQFRHWIACRMPKSLPIPGRLSPAHYGLLYFTKGKPRAFNKVYTPIPSCRHCGGDIRDYGGHRKYLNAKGLNLMDVWDTPEDVWEDVTDNGASRRTQWREADEIWDDIPPVRHSKHKLRNANELAPVMLERVIAFASNPGDLVLDYFAGTGTTLFAAERLGRRWVGADIGDLRPAAKRLKDLLDGEAAPWESARGIKRPGSRSQLSLLGDDPAHHSASKSG